MDGAGGPVDQALAWLHDVVTQTDVQRGVFMDTTGDHVWDAARHLVAFCEAEANQMGLSREGCRVLELGAGCGYLGMTLARNLPKLGTCLMTEMQSGGAFEHLQHNVRLNDGIMGGRAAVAPCDWETFGRAPVDGGTIAAKAVATTTEEPTKGEVFAAAAAAAADDDGDDRITAKHWDLIVGSDLVYNEVGAKMLPALLGRLVQGHTIAYYCHTRYRYESLDIDFVTAVRQHGLRLEEVWRRGDPSPPPSPP
eukprot:CAMPEP_0206305074 /NCGR_PEP_ID=MMETSP0106_2-20121207/10074_1 /ASSEMBLY_ACC=CAM_ASM_000206 /TAXON_ID=81532 /ORGANISM="Acanthoeca-like sp., Strain 10tr" /LENGTH=251 /DNA_ID=CAMNT_0053735907 /DNA_START=62 /DNA_END=813 /DNA_ORIENTATION=-